jgi:xanthine dehydrogenase accessory factor
MNNTPTIWHFIRTALSADQPVILMVVTESSGSSPGRKGFKMAVAGNDSLFGSIGGGLMEQRLVTEARQSFSSDCVSIRHLEHQAGSDHSSGMVCQGSQSVVSYPLHRSFLETVRRIEEMLSTNLNGELLFTTTGIRLVEGGGEPSPALKEGILWQEHLGCGNRLYIFGGGHVGLALSNLMRTLDFHITVIDDRAAVNTLVDNESAHEKLTVDYRDIASIVEERNATYVTIMTAGHASDEVVLRQLLGKRLAYLGVMGSRSKIDSLFNSLRMKGIHPEDFPYLHAPVGLSIGSHTPAEIAVSIAAEIIMVKNMAP